MRTHWTIKTEIKHYRRVTYACGHTADLYSSYQNPGMFHIDCKSCLKIMRKKYGDKIGGDKYEN